MTRPLVAFPIPKTSFTYDVAAEIAALRGYHEQSGKADRTIPQKDAGHLLLATWNIANLGVQKRKPDD